jgi:hypothetical protein
MTDESLDQLVRDLVPRIAKDMGIEISRISLGAINDYAHGQWLYDFDQYTIKIMRRGTGREEPIETIEGLAFKSPAELEAEIRAKLTQLRDDPQTRRPSQATNDWYAMTFPQRRFPFADADSLLKFIEEIWQKNNCPDDFCVFQEIDESYDKLIYFSPAAWRYCREELERGYDGGSCSVPANHVKPVVCAVGFYPACQSLLTNNPEDSF